MKKYCKNCGLDIDYETNFCPSCGSSVDSSELYLDDDVEIDNKYSEYENLVREQEILNDKYLRLVAEFDNYKKRVIKEKTTLIETCNDSLVLDLIDTIENFERAINSENINPGIKAIYSNFLMFLNKHNIKIIECLNKPFDVETMEAVVSVDKEDVNSNIVVDVISNGYMKNNRVIKFAKVVVSK